MRKLFVAVAFMGAFSFYFISAQEVQAQPCSNTNCQNRTCLSTETENVACGSSTCAAGQHYCVASAPTGTPTTVTFSNPLRFNDVEDVLNSLLGTLQSVIVILSIVFIVIGAVLYITSGGSEKQIGTAKAAITASLIGLALGLAAPSFLKEIGIILGWGPVASGPVASALTLTQIAVNVLNFLLSIVGILGIIMLVIGGLTYLTAAGDENRIDTGKKIVTYSVIGILVALAALVLVGQVARFFV